ncbi:hypothetical protein T484DRAFT_1791833 [Baffinella frigidus]|nr:hypothetical protein T484DRAFT_1791833 [Cryptophyta sp. CCMP2293]
MSGPGSRNVAVIGGGPVGIEAAVHLVDEGFRVTVLERGNSVAANVREWFPTGKEFLAQFPTGKEYVAQYVDVLAKWLAEKSGKCDLALGCEVTNIGRGHLLKKDDIGGKKRRITTPFRLLVNRGGDEAMMQPFDYVLDCSGTWNQPNWSGAGGVPAVNERKLAASGRILQHICDPLASPQKFLGRILQHICDPLASSEKFRVMGAESGRILQQICDPLASPEKILGKTVAVVGTGASAITMINSLKEVAEQHKGVVKVEWVARGSNTPYQRVDNDPLPQRDRLYAMGDDMAGVKTPACNEMAGGKSPECLPLTLERTPTAGGEGDEGEGGGAVLADTVVACCGFRPDDTLWSEVQVHQCYATSGPMKLAAALMSASGGAGDCLAQVNPGGIARSGNSPDP